MAVIESVNAALEGKATLQDVNRALQDSGKAPQLDTLLAGVKAQNMPMVQLLLHRKADVNGQDEKGVSALHLAVFDGRLQLVRQLLNAQADPNLRDCHGQSPIFFAPSRQVCKLLIFRQADIELANAKKQTPLHLAAHAGLHQAAACLLETFQSSALDLKDTCGHSPLLYAAKSKVKSIHAFLEGFRTAAQPEHVAEATHSVEGEQQVSVPPVDLEKAELESEEVALQTPQTKCPEGHGLIPFESETDNFVCSVCECEFPMGTVLYGCRNCDYDLCRECLAHTVFHAGGKDFSVALPEMPATFEAVDNNTNVGPGTGEDIRQLTEAESDSGSRTQDTEAQPEHVAEATHSVEGEQQVSVPPVDLEKAELESEEVALQTPQTKCPEGHDLTPFESETDNFVCSVCECEFPMGTVLYGCRNCDYDLCRECLAHTVFRAGGKAFEVRFSEMQTVQSFGPDIQLVPVCH